MADVCRGEHSPLLTAVGFGCLTVNSCLAMFRSQGDTGAVAFVVTSYVDLVLLFFCLRSNDRAPADTSRRKWLKGVVWSLTTMLTMMFAYRVAAMTPLPVAVLVWGMAAVGLVGIYKAFLAPQEIGTTAAAQNTDQV